MAAAKNSKSRKLVPLLLHWFSANARDLPWRRTRDPYAIWVSEIMLQQTQVKTVIPYWNRWMRELPTIKALADAPSEKIHKLWEGLGYYTRVRNLQKAAQQIIVSCRRRGNESQIKIGNRQSAIGNQSATPHVVAYKFPENFDAILALPGIGRNTAGAICSIAFNQPAPILDGNVIRVLTRLFGIATDPREKQTNAKLWQLAEELVNHASRITHHASPCSHLNQSLMELGALLCTPRQPKCPECPVKKHCVAFHEDRVEQLPNLAQRAAATERRFAAFIVERDGKFLVHQRPAGVVNAHLWEFPNAEILGAPSSRRRVSTPDELHLASGTLALPGGAFRLADAKPFCVIKHSITRYRITLEAHRVGAPASGPARNARRTSNPPGRRPALHGRWLTLAELKKLSFPSAHKKILARLLPSLPD